jgi:hypothetical protein
MAALSSSPVQPRPWLVSSAALLAHLVLLGIFYGPTRRLGLMSDAWVIIDVVQGRFRDVLAAPVGYHFIPVSNPLGYAGHAAFGPLAYARSTIGATAIWWYPWACLATGPRIASTSVRGRAETRVAPCCRCPGSRFCISSCSLEHDRTQNP